MFEIQNEKNGIKKIVNLKEDGVLEINISNNNNKQKFLRIKLCKDCLKKFNANPIKFFKTK